MYVNNKYTVKINIPLDNGIYIFDNNSATGKTRLYKELLSHQVYGERVAAYTYNDKLLGRRVDDILIPNKYDVIILDRYDMYYGDGADGIKACEDNTIVLIDCKQDFLLMNTDEWCDIDMSACEIEVIS